MQPYNPYFFNTPNNYPNYMSPQLNRLNQLENQYPGYNNQNMNPNMMGNINSNVQNQCLQGKAVDSIDVVRAMDVPLDGSVTYFPKADGTAIYTKQLQPDGTSKINTYQLNIDSTGMSTPYSNNDVTKDDIEKIYSEMSDIKKSLKDNMNNLLDKFDNLRQEINADSSALTIGGKYNESV